MDEQIMNETRREAEKLIEEGRIPEATPLIRQLAHWGDLDAQKQLIDIYWYGAYSQPRNLQGAFEYSRLAAMNQDTDAMALLGKLFLTGQGCRKDLDSALYFLNKAAADHNADALDTLAEMYLKGNGVPRDIPKAAALIKEAAEAAAQTSSETENTGRTQRVQELDERIARHMDLISKYARRFDTAES